VLQHRGTIQAESLFGVGQLIPQLERRLEVTLGVGEPVGRLGLQPRLHRGGQRTGRVVGPDPVVGEPGRHGEPVGLDEVGTLAQHAGEGGVQPGPLARQQLGVQRFLGQRVSEGVGLGGGVGDEHLVGDGGPQRGEQLRLGQLADRGEQLVLDPAAGSGHDPQRRLRLVGKDLEAAQQDVLELGGQAAPVAVTLVGGGEQFLGEERVALRAAVDPFDEFVVGSVPEDAGQQVGDVDTVEAAQLEPLGPSAAVQCGQERPQGMPSVQLVGAVGQHEQQARL
jgi:hypothetical protein